MRDAPGLDAIVERIDALVSLDTPSGDAARLTACYELISEWGAAVLGRPPQVITREDVPHLYWPAERPAALLLMHADTVFPAGTVAERPFRVDAGRATGPGVFDMKAGIVLALTALESITQPDRIAVLVTGDEEVGSPTSRALVEEAAASASATLIAEPSLHGALKVARKGAGIYQLHFEGRSAHAGLSPADGRNALIELAHTAVALAALGDDELDTTVTPTVAHAGSSVNTVPARATLGLDVRAWTGDELARVDAAIRQLPSYDRDVARRIDGGINRPPMEAAVNRELLETAQRAAAAAGLAVPDGCAVGGGSDGNFTAALGVATLDGLGAIGDGAHTDDEWIDVASLPERAQLISVILDALLAAPPRQSN